MDKNLALALDFKNAPKELQDAGMIHKKNFARVKKAEVQFKLWNAELEAAKKDYKESMQHFNSELDKWTPDASLQEMTVK